MGIRAVIRELQKGGVVDQDQRRGMCTRLDRRITIGQRVDEDMQMTGKDMEHKGQEVKRSEEPKGQGTSTWVLNLSVRGRVELLSERFLAKAEPSYRPHLEAGDRSRRGCV